MSLPDVSQFPANLTSRRQWLCWRMVLKPGQKKPSKMPYYATTGALRGWPMGKPRDGRATEQQPQVEQGHPLDREHLTGFEEAAAFAAARGFDGVGFAFLPGDGLIGIDLDGVIGGDDDRTALGRQITADCDTYGEMSPSGTGLHLIGLGAVETFKSNDIGIEVFCGRQFFTMTGHHHPDTPFEVRQIPEETIGYLRGMVERAKLAAKEARPGAYASPAAPIHATASAGRDEASRYCLAALDSAVQRLRSTREGGRNDMLNGEAFGLGQLLHTGGVSEATVRAALADAALASGLDASEVTSTIRSGIEAGKERPRSIPERQQRAAAPAQAHATADDAAIDPETGEIVPASPTPAESGDTRLAELIGEIERGRSMSGYEDLARTLAMDRTLSTMQRERLASAIQGAIRTFHNTRLPIADVRRMVGIVKSRAGATALVDLQEQRHAPDWVRKWVFRTDCDRFFNLVDKSSVTVTAFDFEHSRLVPPDVRDALGYDKPSELCREVWNTPVIGGVCYLPTAGDLFELDGVPTANSYRPDIVPDGIPPDEWSADERETVRLMEEHLANIIPVHEERRRFVQWLAWAVQRPGDKINWSPLLIGTYGDGKSMLAEMLGLVMGGQNVKALAGGSVVESSFTGWGEGSCVTVIEEVRISGQNRYEVMDRLKPFITNSRVEVHAKHKDPKSIPNTTSYLIFSNWVDAVPVDDKDRRYFILMTPHVGKTGQQLEEAGMGPDYFDRLFLGVRGHFRALRGWLQSVDVADFPAKGRAPESTSKARVVEYCRSDDEIAISDAIEAGGLGITAEVFSSASLAKAVVDAGHHAPKTVAMNRVLQGLGYVQLAERIKWNGEKHRIWHRPELSDGMDAARARKALDATRYA